MRKLHNPRLLVLLDLGVDLLPLQLLRVVLRVLLRYHDNHRGAGHLRLDEAADGLLLLYRRNNLTRARKEEQEAGAGKKKQHAVNAKRKGKGQA